MLNVELSLLMETNKNPVYTLKSYQSLTFELVRTFRVKIIAHDM